MLSRSALGPAGPKLLLFSMCNVCLLVVGCCLFLCVLCPCRCSSGCCLSPSTQAQVIYSSYNTNALYQARMRTKRCTSALALSRSPEWNALSHIVSVLVHSCFCNREGKDGRPQNRRRHNRWRRHARTSCRHNDAAAAAAAAAASQPAIMHAFGAVRTNILHLARRLRLVFTNEFINYYNHSSELHTSERPPKPKLIHGLCNVQWHSGLARTRVDCAAL